MKLFLFLLSSFALNAFAGEKSVNVKEYSYIPTTKIVLKDIARLEGFSASELATLENIELANDLQVGSERSFPQRTLSEILRQPVSKSGDNKIRLVLPEVAIVRRMEDKLTNENVRRKIIEHNQSFCSDCKTELVQVQIPALGKTAIQSWELDLSNRPVYGAVSIPLKIRISKNLDPYSETMVYLKGYVKVEKKYLVAKQNIPAGAIITKDLITTQTRELESIREFSVTENYIIGSTSRKNILQGEIFQLIFLDREKAVRAGQPVRVRMQSDSFEISMNGIAKDNGFIGDVIRVMNPQSNTILSAVVVDKSEVEVK